jgi:hypothetical protein
MSPSTSSPSSSVWPSGISWPLERGRPQALNVDGPHLATRWRSSGGGGSVVAEGLVNEADKASLIATVVRSLVAAMKRTWPAALPKRNANMHVGPDPPLSAAGASRGVSPKYLGSGRAPQFRYRSEPESLTPASPPGHLTTASARRASCSASSYALLGWKRVTAPAHPLQEIDVSLRGRTNLAASVIVCRSASPWRS